MLVHPRIQYSFWGPLTALQCTTCRLQPGGLQPYSLQPATLQPAASQPAALQPSSPQLATLQLQPAGSRPVSAALSEGLGIPTRNPAFVMGASLLQDLCRLARGDR